MCLCGYKFCYVCGDEGATCDCTPSEHGFLNPKDGTFVSPTSTSKISKSKTKRMVVMKDGMRVEPTSKLKTKRDVPKKRSAEKEKEEGYVTWEENFLAQPSLRKRRSRGEEDPTPPAPAPSPTPPLPEMNRPKRGVKRRTRFDPGASSTSVTPQPDEKPVHIASYIYTNQLKEIGLTHRSGTGLSEWTFYLTDEAAPDRKKGHRKVQLDDWSGLEQALVEAGWLRELHNVEGGRDVPKLLTNKVLQTFLRKMRGESEEMEEEEEEVVVVEVEEEPEQTKEPATVLAPGVQEKDDADDDWDMVDMTDMT